MGEINVTLTGGFTIDSAARTKSERALSAAVGAAQEAANAAASATAAEASAAAAETAAEVAISNLADAYSDETTYSIGDYVIYAGQLYKCVSEIETAEAWTAAHWAQVTVRDELELLNAKVTAIDNTAPSAYEYKLSNISGEKAYNTALSQGWTDLPIEEGGIFFNRRYANNFDVQTYIALWSGATYSRIVRRTNRAVYRGWRMCSPADSIAPIYSTSATYAVGDYVLYSGVLYKCITAITTAEAWTAARWTQATVADELELLNAKVTAIDNTASSEYDYLLANVSGEKAYNVMTTQGWTDKPAEGGAVFFNHQWANNFDIQTYIVLGTGVEYNRIIRRTNRAIYRDWRLSASTYTEPVLGLKVLVTGDSICRGGRNSGRGFIGDVGCTYVNIGVGGATLSTKVNSSASTDSVHPMSASNIPDTIIKYSQQTAQSWYIVPDVIIAEGGINDYLKDAPLGIIPTQPVKDDTAAAALDLTTLTGGLQYLFYQMIKLYPDAHRMFLITNRVNTHPWTLNMTNGYTQTDMHDAIVAVCKLYGVDVIDVFNESFINSYFDEYVSPTAYREDSSVTNLYYVDHDKLHPLALGYRTGYAPLVKAALAKAVNL